MGRPPEGMTRQGALSELLAGRGYLGESASTVAPLDIDLLSLPRAGSPVPLAALLGPGGQQVVEDFIRRKVLPNDVAEGRLKECGVKTAY